MTTIAWRIGHLVVGVFGMRVAAHFGGPPFACETHEYLGDAATALAQLDETCAGWRDGVAGLDAEASARPVGAAEPGLADHAMGEHVLHINREAIHHGAEIALLRDLHRRR